MWVGLLIHPLWCLPLLPHPPLSPHIALHRSSLASAQAYAASLGSNSSILLQLAIEQLPSFGVDPASIRSVALNSSSAQAGDSMLGGGTLYTISVQYVAVLVGDTNLMIGPYSV